MAVGLDANCLTHVSSSTAQLAAIQPAPYTPRMRHAHLLSISALCLTLACGDGTVDPGPPPTTTDGAIVAGQFERLADSVDAGGYSPTAEALRHAAEIVRLTGHATPVSVSIDGARRDFLAVSEQIDFPQLECTWSDSGYVPPPDSAPILPPDTVFPPTDSVPPDSGGGGGMPPEPPQPPDTAGPPVEPPEPPLPPICTVVGLYSMRTLIAWEPEEMDEVVRLVAHIGNSAVNPDVPDVMTELPGGVSDPPGTTPPDSGSGSGGEPGGWPGFMGEYLARDVGSWFAFEGNQSNELEETTGACTSTAGTIIDWAEFGCEAVRIRFGFTMTVDALDYERLTGQAGGPEGRHTIAMASTAVDGVRLRWEDWTPTMPDTTAVSR
jgi:hypothetical protein